MNTNNIISTPDITGNIGSCTSQTADVPEVSHYFRNYGHTVVTNSCTGEVTQTPYSHLNSGAVGITGIGFFFLLCVIIAAFGGEFKPEKRHEYDY